MIRSTNRRRRGFTLVELMVMAAVCVLIMAVLSSVFQAGTDTLRQLRSAGEMMDQLRVASEVIKRDLVQPHFLEEDTKPNKGLRVSDQYIDRLNTVTGTAPATVYTGWTPPRGGFFRIFSPPGPQVGGWPGGSFSEGYDSDGLASWRAPQAGQTPCQYVQFTSILPGGADQNLYATTVGGITYTSPAAEIAYFLDPSAGGPTNLIRRQRLVAMGPAEANVLQAAFANPATAGDAEGVISFRWVGPSRVVNTLADVINPANRLGLVNNPSTTAIGAGDVYLSPILGMGGSRLGEDVLLSSVVSFEVKPIWSDPSGAAAQAGPFGGSNTDYPYANLNGPSFAYDTWAPLPNWNATTPNGNSIPNRVRVKSIQIRIRIFDPKLKNSRQLTLTQDL